MSSVRRRTRAFAAATALALGGGLAVAPHAAAVVVAPVTAGQLAAAIASHHVLVTGARYLFQPSGNPPAGGAWSAVASHPIGGLPTSGPTFAILSTGRAREILPPSPPGPPYSEDGTNLPQGNGRGALDVTVLQIDLFLPRGTNCLTFDFRFYSDEWDQIARGFNDAFVAELDATTWTTAQTDRGIEVLASNNFATDPDGGPITAHRLGKTQWISAEDAAGTSYSGATPRLRAAAPVGPGRHSLYLSIFDLGDAEHDSTVIVDNLRPRRSTSCRSGVVPVSFS